MHRAHETGIRGIKGKEEAVRQISAAEENIGSAHWTVHTFWLMVYCMFLSSLVIISWKNITKHHKKQLYTNYLLNYNGPWI